MSISPIGSFMASYAGTGGSSLFSALNSDIATKADTVQQKPLVNVDPENFVGTWKGDWGKEGPFSVQVLQVRNYSAQVVYKNGNTLRSSTVLIRDNTIKIDNMKITMTGGDIAACAAIVTDAATGSKTSVTTTASRS